MCVVCLSFVRPGCANTRQQRTMQLPHSVSKRLPLRPWPVAKNFGTVHGAKPPTIATATTTQQLRIPATTQRLLRTANPTRKPAPGDPAREQQRKRAQDASAANRQQQQYASQPRTLQSGPTHAQTHSPHARMILRCVAATRLSAHGPRLWPEASCTHTRTTPHEARGTRPHTDSHCAGHTATDK